MSEKVTPNRKPLLDIAALVDGPPAVVHGEGKSSFATAQLIVDCRCQLGECVLWDDRTEEILFISILDRTFHSL